MGRFLHIAVLLTLPVLLSGCGGICALTGCRIVGEPSKTSSFRLIAGRFDGGLDGDARQAVFNSNHYVKSYPDLNSLVVTADRTVYFRDRGRGILVIRPADGIARLLIPTTGESTGDGGPITKATLREPVKIALDYANGLLVHDYDRVRRIDLSKSTPTIDTLIGGGTSVIDTVDNPRHVAFTPFQSYEETHSIPGWDRLNTPFIPLPNGDLYFATDFTWTGPGARVRRYHASTGRVTSLRAEGPTASGADASACYQGAFAVGFNPATFGTNGITQMLRRLDVCSREFALLAPTTGVYQGAVPPLTVHFSSNLLFTSRGGEIYAIDRYWSRVGVLDAAGTSFTPVLGDGVPNRFSQCADGGSALSCPVDIDDIYVTEDRTVYFIDRGRIRYIDSTQKVRTLYGVSQSSGDGGPATAAHLNDVNNIDQRASGEIVLLDGQELKLREVTLDGIIRTIAGNGVNEPPNANLPAAETSIYVENSGSTWQEFRVDPANGDVYFLAPRGHTVASPNSWTSLGISRLVRATGQWAPVIHGKQGSMLYSSPAADGASGAEVRFDYPPRVLGIDEKNILVMAQGWNNAMVNSMLKLYAKSDGRQTHFLGVVGASGASASGFCLDGTPVASCLAPAGYSDPFPYQAMTFDPVGKRWITLARFTRDVRTMPEGGNIGTLVRLARAARAIAYVRDGARELVYYCGDDGKLRRNDLSTELELPLPERVQCGGRSLLYNAARRVLYFPVRRDGVHAVGELAVP